MTTNKERFGEVATTQLRNTARSQHLKTSVRKGGRKEGRKRGMKRGNEISLCGVVIGKDKPHAIGRYHLL